MYYANQNAQATTRNLSKKRHSTLTRFTLLLTLFDCSVSWTRGASPRRQGLSQYSFAYCSSLTDLPVCRGQQSLDSSSFVVPRA